MFKKLFSLSIVTILTMFATGINSVCYAAVLSDKTPILVQSETVISEQNFKSGDSVVFKVVNNITDERGSIILKSGTPVYATITRLEQKKRIGRPAELAISGFNTEINGKKIIFNGTINHKSESRIARSIALSAVFLPFFLLMKGAEVELPSGFQTSIYPAVNYSI